MEDEAATFDHSLFLIASPEHGPVHGSVLSLWAHNLLSLSLASGRELFIGNLLVRIHSSAMGV